MLTRQLAGLFVVVVLGGCGKPSGDPPPDMGFIRGDPIEAAVDPGVSEASEASDMPETEWLVNEDGTITVGFERLAGFEYETSATGAGGSTNRIPGVIRELDGREVAVRGFMLPMKVEGGMVKEFLLMRDQSMCCFGVVPRINEWVAVTMGGRGVRAMMDQPVVVFGTLRVGEVYEHEVLAGIYRMEGQEMAGALDL
jgi:hypothetical protein